MLKGRFTLIVFYIWFGILANSSVFAASKTFNLMAPLLIQNQHEWEHFRNQLIKAKNSGATAVSTDVWWGLVESEDQKFNFEYYDRLSNEIISAGLKWMPILSTHQCGGNVGDECHIEIPNWLWTKYSHDPDFLKYKSSQGNYSKEVISAWGTEIAFQDYKDFYQAFYNRYKDKINHILEINISLGPAGELRYPSYNSHDFNTGYPTAGALQSFSELAVSDFRKTIIQKYQNLDHLNQSWGFQLRSWNEIYPPTPPYDRFSNYGKDFFNWYHQSLINHGEKLLSLAQSVFKNFKVGAKVPGIHWRMALDRMAEVHAGLLSTSNPWAFQLTADLKSPLQLGYDKIFELFRQTNTVLHFTCLEMSNYENQNMGAFSLAESLVFLVGFESQKYNIQLMGENALAGSLFSDSAWRNINNVLTHSKYSGVTFLRINSFDDHVWNQFKLMSDKYR